MTFACTNALKASHDVFPSRITGSYGTAVGTEGDMIKRAMERFIMDYYFIPISRDSVPSVRFLRLKEKWEEETAFLSSVTDVAMHPSYQGIIGMGPVVIPMILREMAKRPGQWFWALKSISGEDPVPLEQRGNIIEMTKTWLKWGKQRGYID